MPGFALRVDSADSRLRAQAAGQGAFPLDAARAGTFAAPAFGIEPRFQRGTACEDVAVDYLLKPVTGARLRVAIERRQARLAQAVAADIPALIEDPEARLSPQGERQIRWASASVGDHMRMTGIDEVLFFQAHDEDMRVVTADGEALIHTPVKELLLGVDPDVFWQVRRGTVVRVSTIDRVRRDARGKTRIGLRGHRESLPVTAAFVHRFRGMQARNAAGAWTATRAHLQRAAHYAVRIHPGSHTCRSTSPSSGPGRSGCASPARWRAAA